MMTIKKPIQTKMIKTKLRTQQRILKLILHLLHKLPSIMTRRYESLAAEKKSSQAVVEKITGGGGETVRNIIETVKTGTEVMITDPEMRGDMIETEDMIEIDTIMIITDLSDETVITSQCSINFVIRHYYHCLQRSWPVLHPRLEEEEVDLLI